jgi:glycosyltransferase involved in cell wall biosynthesis
LNPSRDVTVVCPVFNSAKYVVSALETIVAQTIPPALLIVSDDGSTDNTIDKVSNLFLHCPFPTKLIRNVHSGPGGARNAALRATRTPWVGFLDSDDAWLPGKLAKIAERSTKSPNVNLFCHNERVKCLNGKDYINDYGFKFRYDRPTLRQLFIRNRLTPNGVVCRMNLFDAAGYFDEDLTYAEDYDLWLRMAPHLNIEFISDVLGIYNERPGNLSSAALEKRIRALGEVKSRYRRHVGSNLYHYAMLRLYVSLWSGQLKRLFKLKITARN